MVRVQILVKGHVQGVSFRWWIKKTARSMGIVGSVKNLGDGRVEIYAEGEKEKLEEFIDMVKKGPLFCEVEGIDVNWKRSSGQYQSFEVIR